MSARDAWIRVCAGLCIGIGSITLACQLILLRSSSGENDPLAGRAFLTIWAIGWLAGAPFAVLSHFAIWRRARSQRLVQIGLIFGTVAVVIYLRMIARLSSMKGPF